MYIYIYVYMRGIIRVRGKITPPQMVRKLGLCIDTYICGILELGLSYGLDSMD